MKAEEFWKHVCTNLGYKFFSGVPCKGLKPLYDKMDARLMHYVPAVKENIALGLVNGVRLSGIKGGVLLDAHRIHNLMDWLVTYNLEYKTPTFLILFDNEGDISSLLRSYKIPYRTLNKIEDLNFLCKKAEDTAAPVACIIKEGVIE